MPICRVCGKEFYAKPGRIKAGKAKYCSYECAGNAPNKVKRVCLTCGKVFWITPSNIKLGKGKYCSKGCMYARVKKIGFICQICGKKFYVLPCKDRVPNRRNAYCSKECYGKSIIGENNISWNGGSSYGKYCSKFNKAFKRKVRAFFNHKCVLCGKSESDLGYKLHIHHVDYEKDNCCNGSLDPLFVPLCTSCHMKTNFNRYEWEIFFRYYLALGYNNKCF